MRNISLTFTLAAAAGIALAGLSAEAAAPKKAAASKAPAAKAANDSRFITEAAGGGMAEVKLGQLATEKAESADVKSFGQMMVDDHSKANSELQGLAGQKGVTLPSDLPAAEKATYDRLSKLSGAAFDHAYMADMVKDHEKDIAAFKSESTAGKDADVKSWAGKTLPTLEKHLQRAREVAAKTHPASAAHSH
jgi:putative membrane protein